MMPRILSVRSALPEHRLAQAEITRAFASRGKLGPGRAGAHRAAARLR